MGMFVGGLAYADDLTLLVPSPSALCLLRSLRKRRNSWKIPMSHSWERIMLPFPWVTHGKELYVIYTLGYSWDRITCFPCT